MMHITRGTNCYMVEECGGTRRIELLHLFGIAILPTPFGLNMNPYEVLRETKKLNSTETIILEESLR